MVSADAAERDCLMGRFDVSEKSCAVEDAIISMVVLDRHAEVARILFESSFGLDGFVCAG